jgi:putative ABC transport system permease protein
VLFIVITGIFIFTAVKNSALNLSDTLEGYYRETNFGDIFIMAAALPEKLENKLEGTGGIRQAEERLVFDTQLLTDDDDEDIRVRVISADENKNKINELYMKAGRRRLSRNNAIVLDQFAAARNINVGGEIKLLINGREQTFNVTGIASSPEFVYLMENEQSMLPNPEKFGVVYIEKDYLSSISGMKGYNEIVLKLSDENNIDKTADFLDEELSDYSIKRIIKKDEQLSNSMIGEEIGGLEKMSGSVPIVFLLFAGTMLSSMLSRIVKKDRISIGVLKSLGYLDSEIIIHYLKYAASIGVIGGLLGSVIGTILSGLMTKMYLQYFNIPMLSVRFYYYRIAASVALSFLFCIASGFFGVRGILKISPAEAMKPEIPKQGKRIALEKINIIWKKLSFSWKVIMRNIFREKKRFVFISAAVSITCGMLVMTMWMSGIMDEIFNRHYGQFMKMEYNISFSNFQDKSVLKEITKIIDADEIEGRIELPFEISNGRKSKIVSVIGLDTDTEFYQFKNMEGEIIKLPRDGIYISSNLADELDVKAGDMILLKNYVPDMDDGYVTVKGISKQSLGINGYMNIDYLNEKFLGSGIINGAYVNSDDDVLEKMGDIKNIGSIISQDEMKGMFEEYTGLVTVYIAAMILFSGFLGFVIVYSMTLMNINERTLEFSSLRVMGFSKKEIFFMVVKENMIMCSSGILLGIPLGMWLVDYLGKSFSTDIYTIKEPVTAPEVIISVIFTILFLIMAQLITYAKINSLDFMRALKSRIS